MEQIGASNLPPALPVEKKRIRFSDHVEHCQTHGKQLIDGRYEVVVKKNIIPLVDEVCGEDLFTKDDIIKLEQQFHEMLELQKKGVSLELEDPTEMDKARDFFARLNQLFEGHEALPTRLPKSGSHDPGRVDRSHSAGVITNTIGKTNIGKLTNSPSWRTDEHLLSQLKVIHAKAIETLVQNMMWPSSKELKKQMLRFRPMNRKISFTVGDLCSLYLDQCRAKERMMNYVIKEQISVLKTAEEKQELWEKYHTLNWIPCDLSDGKVDVEFLKNSLEKILDVVFDKGTLDARYSEISKADVKEYIRIKYSF